MLLVLLAASLSLDALGVSLGYGLRRVHIPFKSKLVICVVSALYFALACLLGNFLESILPAYLTSKIGILLLGVLCIWMSVQTLLAPTEQEKKQGKKRTLAQWTLQSLGVTITVIRNPLLADMDKSNSIDTKEALFLASALSIDSVGIGISYAMLGAPSLLAPVIVGLFQFVFTSIGNHVGLRLCSSNTAKQNKLRYISCAVLWGMFFIRLLGVG